jgi:hypothetical protein
VKNQHNTSFQIIGTDEKLYLLTREQIKSIDFHKQSLMPADVNKKLNAAEFQDLLAYLSRLSRSRR